MTAGSIAKKIRAGERVSIVSIGAGSVSATVPSDHHRPALSGG